MAAESNRKAKDPASWTWEESWPERKPRSKPAAAEETVAGQENNSTSVNGLQIGVDIRQSGRPGGATKAFGDVHLYFPDGELRLMGFGIIKQPGKPAWVGFPENHGQNKYFPIVLAKGRIRDAIVKAILHAYEKSNANS